MQEVLKTYLNSLKAENAVVLEFLNSGVVIDTNAFSEFDLTLPRDLLKFWSVANGTDKTKPFTLDQIWLDGVFHFFSADNAIEDYKMCFDLWQEEEGFDDYWPRGFFPIGSPGDGSRLLINCLVQSPTFGQVYELFHGVGVSKHAVSLKQYFETRLAQLEGGVVFIKDRIVEMNFDTADNVAAKMNTGCDAYDDDLPPAYEVRDWLG